MTTIKLQEEIEKIMDQSSVKTILETMSEICFLKASHLEESWQDEASAKLYEKGAIKLDEIKENKIFEFI